MKNDINTDPLVSFMGRVRTMAQTRSKEIRMTADEVTELSATISQVLVRMTALQDALAPPVTEIEISGGTF